MTVQSGKKRDRVAIVHFYGKKISSRKNYFMQTRRNAEKFSTVIFKFPSPIKRTLLSDNYFLILRTPSLPRPQWPSPPLQYRNLTTWGVELRWRRLLIAQATTVVDQPAFRTVVILRIFLSYNIPLSCHIGQRRFHWYIRTVPDRKASMHFRIWFFGVLFLRKVPIPWRKKWTREAGSRFQEGTWLVVITNEQAANPLPRALRGGGRWRGLARMIEFSSTHTFQPCQRDMVQ